MTVLVKRMGAQLVTREAINHLPYRKRGLDEIDLLARISGRRDVLGRKRGKYVRCFVTYADNLPHVLKVYRWRYEQSLDLVREGMYYHDVVGMVARVQRMQYGDFEGQLMVKAHLPIGPHKAEQVGMIKWNPDKLTGYGFRRMSFAEAQKFGRLYGTCAVCGRTLTNETSIDRGIGPVCWEEKQWA